MIILLLDCEAYAVDFGSDHIIRDLLRCKFMFDFADVHLLLYLLCY